MPASIEPLELGQFIPLHYHFNMLNDSARMRSFKAAIEQVVHPDAQVLELGGGTGVLSFFAAQQGARVRCVERNPELVAAARNILNLNGCADRVEVIQADASLYLPPEPVDVVICEMLHAGMLREKQLAMIDAFKRRYIARFGAELPAFVPEACIQAIQPVQQNFDFEGYVAPMCLFQEPTITQDRTLELSEPCVFQLFSYEDAFSIECAWDGLIDIESDGLLNAVRVITKNVLAISVQEQRTIDWHNQYLVVPLPEALPICAGDRIAIRFGYEAGAPLNALLDSLDVRLVADRPSSTAGHTSQAVA